MIESNVTMAPELVADHYDELDRWYRMLWGEHVHHGLWLTGRESAAEATHNMVTRLAEGLAVSSGQTLCDIGCGYGATGRVLTREYGASVTGLTLSAAQHAYAIERNTEQGDPEILRMDFMESGFEAESFDAAFSIESSEHFADKPGLFTEMFRIVRPGGRIGVCAWLAKAGASARQVDWLLEPICREGRLPGLGTEEEYRDWMTAAGFEEIAFEDYSRNVRRTWPIIVGRMARRLLWDLSAWRFLFSGARNVDFGKTIFRIWLAYRTGCLRYGMFTARKPDE